jgi:zinc D-Ala-D-Ala dipeptidase
MSDAEVIFMKKPVTSLLISIIITLGCLSKSYIPSSVGDVVFASQSVNKIPKGFVYVKDVIPNIILDIRYYGNHNFIGTRIDGYLAPKAILTKETAEALKKIQGDLNTYSLGIKVFDAYRPQSAVNHFIRWSKDTKDIKMKKEFYPDEDKKDLFTKGYIAEKSGHSRGSTIDLTLIDLKTGIELDMGGSFDFLNARSASAYQGITPQQRANRLLLRNIMEKYGFKHYSKEWWHFTLIREPYPKTYFNFPVY